MIIVRKFGGASLQTPEQIVDIARRLSESQKSGDKNIIVVSAMGKTTDSLIQLAHQVSQKPEPRELDMLLTAGERISMSLMTMALNAFGTPAISFTGSQAGILTDDRHSDAKILDVKPIRVEEALRENKIVVLAGFQGVNPQTKEITTLGRGGSDTTAVAFAAHFKATRCEILKEVDGVMTADPDVVKNAKLISVIPLESLQNMCQGGAKVLHYKSVELALKLKVPISVGRADSFKIGTRTTFNSADTNFKRGELIAVNTLTQNDNTVITLTSFETVGHGLETAATELFSQNQIRYTKSNMTPMSISFNVHSQDRKIAANLLHNLVGTAYDA